MSDEDTYESDDDDVEMESDAADVSYVAAPVDEVGLQDEGGVVAMREALRKQLQADVEAFLAAGGKINEIPANVVSDPPKKPQSNYGGQPI
jgi:hypothetical protein